MTERRSAAGASPSAALRPSTHAAETTPPADGRTRDRVAQLLLEHGPSTAVALGEALGLSAPAVRRHLDSLLAEGTIAEREPRALPGRGRGRPAKVFALTDAGREAFPHAYDDLAVQRAALPAQHRRGARGGGLRRGPGRRPRRSAADRRERAADARRARRRGGCHPHPRRVRRQQRPRPAGAAALPAPLPGRARRRGVPAAVRGRDARPSPALLGTHVQRLATIAHGDGVCTTYLPGHPGALPSPPSAT